MKLHYNDGFIHNYLYCGVSQRLFNRGITLRFLAVKHRVASQRAIPEQRNADLAVHTSLLDHAVRATERDKRQ